MNLISQLYLQRETSVLKAERRFGGSLETPWARNEIYGLGMRSDFSVSVAHVPRLDSSGMLLLISILASFATVVSHALLAASRIFFESIEALPPRLPHIALAARLLPTPAATRR